MIAAFRSTFESCTAEPPVEQQRAQTIAQTMENRAKQMISEVRDHIRETIRKAILDGWSVAPETLDEEECNRLIRRVVEKSNAEMPGHLAVLTSGPKSLMNQMRALFFQGTMMFPHSDANRLRADPPKPVMPQFMQQSLFYSNDGVVPYLDIESIVALASTHRVTNSMINTRVPLESLSRQLFDRRSKLAHMFYLTLERGPSIIGPPRTYGKTVQRVLEGHSMKVHAMIDYLYQTDMNQFMVGKIIEHVEFRNRLRRSTRNPTPENADASRKEFRIDIRQVKRQDFLAQYRDGKWRFYIRKTKKTMQEIEFVRVVS
jgi:hypothetical protein